MLTALPSLHQVSTWCNTVVCWKFGVDMWCSSLVPSPPLLLAKWPQKRWSGIFGPIPWLASTYLEYFWQIRSPLDHVLTKPRVCLVHEDMEDDSQTFFYGSWICHRTGSQSWTIHNPRKNAYTLRLLPIQLHVRVSAWFSADT